MVSKSTSKSPVSDGQVKKKIQSGVRKRVSSDGMTDQLTKGVDETSSNSDVSDHQEKSGNISDHQEKSGNISDHQEKSGNISDHEKKPTDGEGKDSRENGVSSEDWIELEEDEERWNPFVIKIQVNMVAWSLFSVAFILRLWGIDSPRSIVFDELHYGRFISMYIRGIFFFDSQPPLGKQLVSLAAYLGGYDGSGMNWTSIGSPYTDTVPLKALRIVPAICGSLIVPVLYHLTLNLRLGHQSALLSSLFYLLENTFLTQSRFILMDIIQIFFSMTGLLFLTHSRNQRLLSLTHSRNQGTLSLTHSRNQGTLSLTHSRNQGILSLTHSRNQGTLSLTHSQNQGTLSLTHSQNQGIPMDQNRIKTNREKYFLSFSWLINLLLASLFLSFGVCVKFTAIYTLILGIVLVLYDFWWIIPDQSIKTIKIVAEGAIYIFSFIILPVIIYLSVFYVHLSWLTKAGPHDNVLTSAFQASLEGGLASITKGQPLEIVHGSQVTLRHTHGRACWLHSHPHVYPVKYSDSRGSSHQQQVTCYSFKDVNNWWIVKKPTHDDLVVLEPLERIKHGDVIQLIHGITGRSLNSHDVAAPMSPANQEVSCYIDYNITMPSQNLWRVELINGEETNYLWHTIRSLVHLIHLNSTQALKYSGKQLPDWGFNQHEIVTDKSINQDDTIWNVEEHRYTKDSDAKDRERDLISAQFVPMETTQLTFWAKMKELQYKMIFGSDHDKIDGHMFQVDSPVAWVTLYQGLAYWVSTKSNSQIYLIGNIVLWYISLLAMMIHSLLFVWFMIRRRRKLFDLDGATWEKFTLITRFCLIGYLINFLPYFFLERTLFLHHYLPALIFQHFSLVSIIHFGANYFNILLKKINFRLSPNLFIYSLITPLISVIIFSFIHLLPLSYGSGDLTLDQIQNMKWRKSWHFITHDN